MTIDHLHSSSLGERRRRGQLSARESGRRQLTPREDGMLVRTPYSRYKDGLRALHDMTGTRSSDSGETMLRVVEVGRALSLHGSGDGPDPSSVGVDDGGSDGCTLEKTELLRCFGRDALADGLTSREDEPRVTRGASDLLVGAVGLLMRRSRSAKVPRRSGDDLRSPRVQSW